jgi:hypothetical protein
LGVCVGWRGGEEGRFDPCLEYNVFLWRNVLSNYGLIAPPIYCIGFPVSCNHFAMFLHT